MSEVSVQAAQYAETIQLLAFLVLWKIQKELFLAMFPIVCSSNCDYQVLIGTQF